MKTPGACNNDILVSVSNDGGQTFTGTTTDPRQLPSAHTESGQATTDQFWQWISFTKNGKLATSYYDRQYGTRNPDLFVCRDASSGQVTLPPSVCGGKTNNTTLNDQDTYTANVAVPSTG